MLPNTILRRIQMDFRLKRLNNEISFLYGFKTSASRIYDMVMTIEDKGNVSEIHAWLSKTLLTPKDLKDMWNEIKKFSKSNYIEFEVFGEHALFYQKIFKSIDIKKKVTFDGFESYMMTVHRECEMFSV